MNTITIKGKEYKIKYTLRAIFLFESIADKQFEIKSTLDNYLFFYCMIIANNEDILSWDEYINALDEEPSLFLKMNEIVLKMNKLDELILGNSNEVNNQKKN